MAGHSHFANIKYKKERQDAVRGKLFAKLSKEITVAVRQGGSDPEMNYTLASALERAKDCNMPKDNIERAIKRATGELEGYDLEEISYEGFGPDGVAVMIHAITDNRNRTATDLRNLFSKAGGSLGGSVAWMFERRGLVSVQKSKLDDPESFMLEALDWGAEDLEDMEESIELYCDPSQLQDLRDRVKAAGVEPEQAEVTMVPNNTVKLEGDAAEKIIRFMQNLDEHDDVQNVYANFEVPDEVLEAAAG